MSEAQLLAFVNSRPFEPFVITMVGGKEYAVKHPEFVSPSRAGLGIWILHESGHIEALGTGLMLSIRTMNPTDPSNLIG